MEWRGDVIVVPQISEEGGMIFKSGGRVSGKFLWRRLHLSKFLTFSALVSHTLKMTLKLVLNW